MEDKATAAKNQNWSVWLGLGLIIFGIAGVIELSIHSGWLIYLFMVVYGAFLLFWSLYDRNFFESLLGCSVLFLSIALFFMLSPIVNWDFRYRLAALFGALGVYWGVIYFFAYQYLQKKFYWALFIAFICGSIGACFSLTGLSFLDFILFVGCGTGLGLLYWGYQTRLFGLIIPGCLISSTALGVYSGWNSHTTEPNGLARTGIMLVVFGIGWACITLFSRRVYNLFIWWPLIPALVISVTGWGLYIGGNPSDAGKFLGNTGFLTSIILGVYVLLLRRSFKKE